MTHLPQRDESIQAAEPQSQPAPGESAEEFSVPITRGRLIGELVLVLGLALMLGTWRLGDSPLIGREALRAMIAHAMARSNQWILPYLDGQLFLTKPPLIFWIMGGLERLVGTGNEWVWRLPSAIGSAVLAAGMFGFAHRWFGRPAGLVAGLSCCGLIVIWEQNRAADIDGLNTVAASLAACAIIDLLFGPARRRLVMIFVAAICVGATLLLKLHGGLPIIGGALVGGPLLTRDWRGLRRPGIWIALIAAALAFAAYGAAVYYVLKTQHIELDRSGLDEAADLSFFSAQRVALALALPFTLFAYSLPVSAAAIFAILPAVRGALDAPARARALALLGAMSGAQLIALLATMSNVRYAYPITPVLCPLAGAVAVAFSSGRLQPKISRSVLQSLQWAAGALAVGVIVLGIVAMRTSRERAALAVVALVAIAAGFIAVRKIAAARWNAVAVLIAVLLVALMIPYAQITAAAKFRDSALSAAPKLAQYLPPGTHLITGITAMYQPELFYYAGVEAQTYLTHFDKPIDLPHSGWLVLKGDEYPAWLAATPRRITDGVYLWPPDGTRGSAIYLVWYISPDDPQPPPVAMPGATTQPAASVPQVY